MENSKQKIKVAITDDHQLFRKGLSSLLHSSEGEYDIIFEAANGHELQKKMALGNLPNIVLLDINMPSMDGFEVVDWLKQHYPELSVLIISMIEKEETIVRMLKMGVKGYLTKNVSPEELHTAITAVLQKGYYYADFITGRLIHSLFNDNGNTLISAHAPALNDREKTFLQFVCTELTYRQIADKMFLSHKTIDGYRNALFEKFDVKSRTGLALYAIRNSLVSL